MTAAHPSRAELAAFAEVVAIARSPQPSFARTETRLLLGAGYHLASHGVAGRIRHGRSGHRLLVLAHGQVTARAHRQRRIILSSGVAGSRLLRILEIVGAYRNQTISVRVTVTAHHRVRRVVKHLHVL